ncbi:MAG: thiamine phosphate synthase [Firmicutes bacterium]|nr:thiamine phosphate synthase [Bacillota bacterium]
MKIQYDLYLLTDKTLAKGRPLEQIVKEAILGGATLVQYRAKNTSSRRMLEEAQALLALTRRHQIPLIVNDRLDIALAIDAEGVHLGQDDIPCSLARKLMGSNKIIGISASTPEEARQAESDGADYLGVGAVFPTATKADAGEAIGLDNIRAICEAVSIPIVAIGGINLENAASVAATGVAGLAVISALISAPDPKHTASALKRAFYAGKAQSGSPR